MAFGPPLPEKTMRPVRVALVLSGVVAVLAQAQSRPARGAAAPPFTVVEATIDDMRKALEQKRTMSHDIVVQYLQRIATYEHVINATITVNPKGLAIADS